MAKNYDGKEEILSTKQDMALHNPLRNCKEC
jgi:hypothetical protein